MRAGRAAEHPEPREGQRETRTPTDVPPRGCGRSGAAALRAPCRPPLSPTRGPRARRHGPGRCGPGAAALRISPRCPRPFRPRSLSSPRPDRGSPARLSRLPPPRRPRSPRPGGRVPHRPGNSSVATKHHVIAPPSRERGRAGRHGDGDAVPGRPAACSSRTAVVTSGEEGWARRALTWASSPPRCSVRPREQRS